MLESSNQLRGEIMGKPGDDGLRTVECLRGRLLAERAASKAAKSEAELLTKRLAELEKKLAEEIKYRDKAEKKLNYALKKLESLKLLDISSQLNLSRSSVSSSSTYLSAHQDSECRRAEEYGQCDSMGGGDEKINGDSVDSSPDFSDKLFSENDSWTSHSHNEGSQSEHEERKTQESIIVSDSEPEMKKYSTDNKENSLALVPINMWPISDGCKPGIKNDVQGVLLSLRLVKEQLQNSMVSRKPLLLPENFIASEH